MPEPARHAIEPEPRHPRQMLRDLIRPHRSQLLVACLLLLCGLALTVQVSGRDQEQYAGLRQEELVAVLDSLTSESRRLETQIAELEATRDQLRSGADASQVALQESQRRLDELELLAGTVRAEGPGIQVTISDPSGRITTDIVLSAIEELRDAGAEVIEFNDRVRIVAHSWVGIADGGLVIDGTTLHQPYTIEAIGDPDTLAEAMRFRGGLVSRIESDRVQGTARVDRPGVVRIDSVATARTPRFARPA